jgi:hypothetical protein
MGVRCEHHRGEGFDPPAQQLAAQANSGLNRFRAPAHSPRGRVAPSEPVPTLSEGAGIDSVPSGEERFMKRASESIGAMTLFTAVALWLVSGTLGAARADFGPNAYARQDLVSDRLGRAPNLGDQCGTN